MDLHYQADLSPGFDAMSGYAHNLGGQDGEHPWSDLTGCAESRWNARLGFGQVPLATSSWDGRPRIETPVSWCGDNPSFYQDWYIEPTPQQLADHLRTAMDFATSGGAPHIDKMDIGIDEPPTPPPFPTSVATPAPTLTPIIPYIYELQVETETTWDDAYIESDHAGYTGSGYVNTVNAMGTWIEWSIDVLFACKVYCEFTYACASEDRSMDLIINGNTVTSLSFPASGSWTTWIIQEARFIITAGSNTIRLTATTSGGAPMIDKMGFNLITIGTPPPTDLIGDVNGEIDIVDALLIAQYYVELDPENFILANADFNKDGIVDIIDSLLIAQYYVGLIDLP